jgi:hypothetical protein
MRKLILSQFFVLLIGTVFAWTNFTIELFAWLNDKPCTTGCSLDKTAVVNPFFTPCFYGAIFFTLAFVLSLILVIKSKKSRENTIDAKNS